MIKKPKKRLTEITAAKTRDKEEKFYVRFSETQLNAVLLLILGNTFFVQAASKFLEDLVYSEADIKLWFLLVVYSLLFLVLSVGSITFGGIVNSLYTKRVFNLLSFSFFIIGIGLFVFSLGYLIWLF